MTHQDQKDEARHPEADIVPKSDSTILVKTYVTNLSAQETEQAVSLFSTSGQSVQFLYIFLIILSLCVYYNLYGPCLFWGLGGLYLISQLYPVFA